MTGKKVLLKLKTNKQDSWFSCFGSFWPKNEEWNEPDITVHSSPHGLPINFDLVKRDSKCFSNFSDWFYIQTQVLDCNVYASHWIYWVVGSYSVFLELSFFLLAMLLLWATVAIFIWYCPKNIKSFWPLNLWNFNYFNKTILRLLTVLICYLKVKTNLCENYISIVNKKRYFGTKFVFPASVYGGNRLNRYGAALGLMNHDIPTLKTV